MEAPVPELLPGTLPLSATAQVTQVVEWEEEAVPGHGEPGDSQRGIQTPEGHLGELGGATP